MMNSQTPSKKRPREVEALTDSSRTKRVRKANTRYKDEVNIYLSLLTLFGFENRGSVLILKLLDGCFWGW